MTEGSFVEIKSSEIQREEIVGGGSYGKVYKATWGDKCVAVKVMKTDIEKEINAFRNEYAEDGSLHDLLHNTTKSYTTVHAISWAEQCAEAIDYLHSMEPKPLVHRDLKPLNLLLFDQGRILKICDFGTVRDKATIMTRNTGSIAWMAPEMFDVNKVYSEKCDVYSFGIILWEIMFRELPFAGFEWPQILMAVFDGSRPPIGECCPKSIKDLITECWDPSPEKRPSMKAVIEQLLTINLDESLPPHSLFVEYKDEAHRSDLAAAMPEQLPSSSGHRVVERRVNFSLHQLHSAAQNGKSEAVERLLRDGASVHVKDNFGVAPLHYAADSGNEAIVRLLLIHQANINERNNDKATPLYLAALNGHTKVVSILLEKGAGVNLGTSNGMTPLITAARNGHEQVVNILINNGAVVNATDITGFTPLHYAASNGHGEIVDILLNKAADFDVKNIYGETPLHYAAEKGHESVVKIFSHHKANRSMKTKNGVTPLHIAILNGHKIVVCILVDSRAEEVDVPTNDGVTPLHFAAGTGNNEIVDILLRNRATVDKKDNSGRTPLHYAAREGHGETVKNLLNNRASIDAKENYGLTPLHYATLGGHDKAVNILLRAGAVMDEKWFWMKNELGNDHIRKPQ